MPLYKSPDKSDFISAANSKLSKTQYKQNSIIFCHIRPFSRQKIINISMQEKAVADGQTVHYKEWFPISGCCPLKYITSGGNKENISNWYSRQNVIYCLGVCWDILPFKMSWYKSIYHKVYHFLHYWYFIISLTNFFFFQGNGNDGITHLLHGWHGRTRIEIPNWMLFSKAWRHVCRS